MRQWALRTLSTTEGDVALPLDGDVVGMEDDAVDEGDGGRGVAKIVGQSRNARLVVSTRLFGSCQRPTTSGREPDAAAVLIVRLCCSLVLVELRRR